jgi:hypothetical protein
MVASSSLEAGITSSNSGELNLLCKILVKNAVEEVRRGERPLGIDAHTFSSFKIRHNNFYRCNYL